MPEIVISGYPENLKAHQVTFAAGASVTEIFPTQGYAIIGLEIPSTWTAAAIGYKSCISGNPSKLMQVDDNGANPEKTKVTAGHNTAIPQSDTIFAPFMQLVSVDPTDGTTPVNQVSAVTVTMLLRRYLS